MPRARQPKQKPTPNHAAGLDMAAMKRHAGEAAALLKAMAGTPRLIVLCSLAGAERSVGELLQEIPLSASALSQHLAILRREGLVTTRREAQTIHYALAPGPAIDIIASLHACFCAPGISRGRGQAQRHSGRNDR